MSKIDIVGLILLSLALMIIVTTCSGGANSAHRQESRKNIEGPRELSRVETGDEQAAGERRTAEARGEKIGDSPEDAIIHRQILERLSEEGIALDTIRVDVESGTVTLRGMVETAGQGAEAEKIAKSVDGVMQLNDQLKVRSRPTKAQRRFSL